MAILLARLVRGRFMSKNNFCFFSCQCGCGNTMMISKTEEASSLYVSFLSSDFYNEQKNPFDWVKHRLKFLMELSINRKILLKDIIVSEEDILRLKEVLKSTNLKNVEKNHSHIKIMFDKDFGYLIHLVSKPSWPDIITGKYYRQFDLEIGDNEKKEMIKMINRATKQRKILTLMENT